MSDLHECVALYLECVAYTAFVDVAGWMELVYGRVDEDACRRMIECLEADVDAGRVVRFPTRFGTFVFCSAELTV